MAGLCTRLRPRRRRGGTQVTRAPALRHTPRVLPHRGRTQATGACTVHHRAPPCSLAQAEIVRFEELVIQGGPIVLSGTLALLSRVRRRRSLCIVVRPLTRLCRGLDRRRELRDSVRLDHSHFRYVWNGVQSSLARCVLTRCSHKPLRTRGPHALRAPPSSARPRNVQRRRPRQTTPRAIPGWRAPTRCRAFTLCVAANFTSARLRG